MTCGSFTVSIKFVGDNSGVEIILGKGMRIVKFETVFTVEGTTFAYDEKSNNVYISRSDARLGEPKEISFSLVHPR